MVERGVVGERVAGDRGADRDREADVAPRRGRRAAAEHDDARRDEEYARDLDRARVAPAEERRGGQNEHGRSPAGDRVDDAEVRAGVGGGEQGEVADLERDRDREEGEGLGVEVPGERGERQADDRDQRERRGRRGAGVARACQQDVPAGMQRRGGQREEECVDGHAAQYRGCGDVLT